MPVEPERPARLAPIASEALMGRFRAIVGERHVLTGDVETRRYRTGYRFGGGAVLAVVRPGSLVEQWQLVKACAQAGVIMLFQAANTGLTGGSTPSGDDYDRDVVLISTTRIEGVHLIDEGRQVICLPGLTLDRLERVLSPLGREPHSLIGSSCIGASVLGGICNNSGGSLVKRGPAYTELALFARIRSDGEAELVNHLGVALGDEPEVALRRLEAGDFTPADIEHNEHTCASDQGYEERLRDVDAPTPARFNADPGRLFEASGSAGRVALFAVRLDTFEKPRKITTFYIGTNDPNELADLRRDMLTGAPLPIAAEYMDRDAFDIAARYGKDVFLAIRWLGTRRIGGLFAAKSRVDGMLSRFGPRAQLLSDRVLQVFSNLLPDHLPGSLMRYRERFSHHLMIKVADDAIEAVRTMIFSRFPSASGDAFECTPAESELAFLHRFAAASAAVRYRAVHADQVEDIVALDIALPRNTRQWVEHLPHDLTGKLVARLAYGHFLCHVFHQDYIVAAGHDVAEFEHEICHHLDARGAKYPAEHNVGHLYAAGPEQAAFFRELDPCNQMNPGIGHTSKRASWR